MYAMTVEAPGGPEALIWREVPDPAPGQGGVVIEVAATAVNRADLLQRQGHYPPPPGAPPYLGLECSGTVVAIGDAEPESGRADAQRPRWRLGDQVCALLPGGGYAERVAVPADHVLPIPEGVDLVSAAALPEAACTVWSNLSAVARLRSGETVLVHGGGSGIGTFAIQYAAALGATVITTARSAKHGALRSLGAHATIDYATEDYVSRLDAITDGHGADVILDIVGAKYLSRNVEALAEGGRLVIIGLQGGRRAELDIAPLMGKCATVAATTLRPRSRARKAEIVSGVATDVWPFIGSGAIRPVIDRALPMREARLAHQIVERSDHIGKVLLVND